MSKSRPVAPPNFWRAFRGFQPSQLGGISVSLMPTSSRIPVFDTSSYDVAGDRLRILLKSTSRIPFGPDAVFPKRKLSAAW